MPILGAYMSAKYVALISTALVGPQAAVLQSDCQCFMVVVFGLPCISP